MNNKAEFERVKRLNERLIPEFQSFRDSRKTLQLSTVSGDGIPNASYAPFAFDSSAYYILISDLALHGQNMRANPLTSILLIEDESQSQQIYARKRISFDTHAERLERHTTQWHSAIAMLQNRFGDIVENLAQLSDFNLYKLVPKNGRYVKGFGQAYLVSSEELLAFTPITSGHSKDTQSKDE